MDQGADRTNSVDKPNLFNDHLFELQGKLSGLQLEATTRLGKLERHVKNLDDGDASSFGGSVNVDESDDEDNDDRNDDTWRLDLEENMINEVRYVDFEHFKNRYDESEGKFCIEALVAGSNLGRQIRRELTRRNEDFVDDDQSSDDGDDSGNDDNEEDLDGEKTIRRVRIQSPSALFFLHHVLKDKIDTSWNRQSLMTFYPPFGAFIEAQGMLKAKLKELEAKHASNNVSEGQIQEYKTIAELVSTFSHASQGEAEKSIDDKAPEKASAGTTTHTALPSLQESDLPGKTASKQILERAILESYQSLLALRCLVSFIDERIIPQEKAFDPVDPASCEVRYQDIYHLYTLGELVAVTPSMAPSVTVPRTPTIGRVFLKRTQIPFDSDLQRKLGSKRRCLGANWKPVLTIGYYTLDFNGHSYVPITDSISLPRFERRSLRSLPVIPLRFHADADKIISQLQASGKSFSEAVKLKHLVYRGWNCPAPERPAETLNLVSARARARLPRPEKNRRGINPLSFETEFNGLNSIHGASKVDYIESNVIIDVSEATRVFPHWAIRYRNLFVPFKDSWNSRWDTIPILCWSDHHRRNKLSIVRDRTLVEDGISTFETAEYCLKDKFDKGCKDPDFTDEDILLLPGSLYAYALRDRKFFVGHSQLFRKYTDEERENPFDSLKIDPEHIRTVQSVVWTHFQQKIAESLPGFSSQIDQDLIRGKGRGLVILLHGVPGVGKTATAEAVALWHKKPLFSITCGDLGFTPDTVESSLGEIFRFAHLWDCILLLDEADVFLSQRETNSLQRNALVSVFLRVLEYYNGILFLTTNRVGTLDEAFKSRVHLSLYYPALNQAQTEDIMRMNLRRLAIIEKQRAQLSSRKTMKIFEERICGFAVKHYVQHVANDGEGRWNGRQIRNAVQIAASLALYEKESDQDDELPAMLDSRHFETVQKTMIHFEGYMSKTRGGSSTFIAKQRAERDDGFKGAEASHTRNANLNENQTRSNAGIGEYSPYQHRPQTPQTFGVPPVHHGQQYSSPPGNVYGHHRTPSSSHVANDPAAQVYGPAEGYRPAMQHATAATQGMMPSVQAGMSQYGIAPAYTTAPPQPGFLPPGDQGGVGNVPHQGYQPTH